MSTIQTKHFTTSEMAKICGVTKHTLFHYDDIGLLKPDFVNEKGYRFYSFKQCYALDIINVLKKAGSSLQEIKDFFQNQSTAKFIHLIQQKQRELEMEHLRIKRMQNFLEGAVEMTKTATNDLRDTPIIEECEAQYFITTEVGQCVNEQEFAKKLREHRDYSEKHLILHEFPLWTILHKERFESELYYPNYIAYKLISPTQTEKLITRPKGTYAVMDHIGSYDTMPYTYAAIKKFISSKGMQVCGDVYEMEMLNYLTEEDPDNFIIRISVGVS